MELRLGRRHRCRVLTPDVVNASPPGIRDWREPGRSMGPSMMSPVAHVHDPQHGFFGAAFAEQVGELVALHEGWNPSRWCVQWGQARWGRSRTVRCRPGPPCTEPELLPRLPPTEELALARHPEALVPTRQKAAQLSQQTRRAWSIPGPRRREDAGPGPTRPATPPLVGVARWEGGGSSEASGRGRERGSVVIVDEVQPWRGHGMWGRSASDSGTRGCYRPSR